MVSEQQSLSLLAVVFLPMAAALLLPLFSAGLARTIALASSFAGLGLALTFVGPMNDAVNGAISGPESLADFALVFSREWMPSWGISFTLGLDGLSGLLVILTNLLVIVSILASWTAIASRQKEFYAFLLVLQTGILGTFLALDLFVFYIFWELMLVPLYFLIGIFGSSNRIYATMKFFLYTMAGSVLMLLGILTLHFQTAGLADGARSFGIFDLLAHSQALDPGMQTVIFFSFFLAFAIKVPLFPFHTWLPDAHTEAPTAGSILLAGVLLKTGVYGMMRFAIPLFPAVAREYAWIILILSVIAIIYGALTALVQTDLKRLVAYSSVSHMGFIMLGLFAFHPLSVSGASLQMLNHGISTGALFFCVGVLYERRHTRQLSEFGGLAHNMKIYTVLTVIVVLSSVGLPGLNGFIGEFLILLGTFQTHPWFAAVAATGVVFAAIYLLRMVMLTFFGPLDNEKNKNLSDVNPREIFSLTVLIALAFWIGLFPNHYLKLLEPTSNHIAAIVEDAGDLGGVIDIGEAVAGIADSDPTGSETDERQVSIR